MAVAVALWGLFAAPALAGVCTVPGTHASIQAAIDDAGCMAIELAAQTYDESIHVSRPLTLAGPSAGGAFIEGLVQVVGGGSAVSLVDLTIRNGCPLGTLRVVGGARVTGTNLQIERSKALPCAPSLLFEDGFESGDTSAWSTTAPWGTGGGK